MKKHLILYFLISAVTVTAWSQKNQINLGLGGVYEHFQDTRFSNLDYSGPAIFATLGLRKAFDQSFIDLDGRLALGSYKLPVESDDRFSSNKYDVALAYQHRISDGWYVGPRLNILDMNSLTNNATGNSSNFYYVSSDLYLSTSYFVDPFDWLTVELGGAVGLLSFYNTAPSFTTNFPQSVIEAGELSFQNMNIRLPYSFKYFNFAPGYRHLNLKTHLEAYFSRRWSIFYDWNLKRFSDHKSYPVTLAKHNLGIKFQFIKLHK